jgi:ParB family chromosome partitioning protein
LGRPVLRKVKVGDLRIYFNSISKIVDTIRSQGVDAYSKRSETEEFIEYTITIPKNNGGDKLTVI